MPAAPVTQYGTLVSVSALVETVSRYGTMFFVSPGELAPPASARQFLAWAADARRELRHMADEPVTDVDPQVRLLYEDDMRGTAAERDDLIAAADAAAAGLAVATIFVSPAVDPRGPHEFEVVVRGSPWRWCGQARTADGELHIIGIGLRWSPDVDGPPPRGGVTRALLRQLPMTTLAAKLREDMLRPELLGLMPQPEDSSDQEWTEHHARRFAAIATARSGSSGHHGYPVASAPASHTKGAPPLSDDVLRRYAQDYLAEAAVDDDRRLPVRLLHRYQERGWPDGGRERSLRTLEGWAVLARRAGWLAPTATTGRPSCSPGPRLLAWLDDRAKATLPWCPGPIGNPAVRVSLVEAGEGRRHAAAAAVVPAQPARLGGTAVVRVTAVVYELGDGGVDPREVLLELAGTDAEGSAGLTPAAARELAGGLLAAADVGDDQPTGCPLWCVDRAVHLGRVLEAGYEQWHAAAAAVVPARTARLGGTAVVRVGAVVYELGDDGVDPGEVLLELDGTDAEGSAGLASLTPAAARELAGRLLAAADVHDDQAAVTGCPAWCRDRAEHVGVVLKHDEQPGTSG